MSATFPITAVTEGGPFAGRVYPWHPEAWKLLIETLSSIEDYGPSGCADKEGRAILRHLGSSRRPTKGTP